MTLRRGRRTLVAGALVVVVALLAACTRGNDEDGGGSGGGSGEAASGVDALATLEVIDERIDVRVGTSEDFVPGATGMGLEVGDEVRSDVTGFGELGFFDGSWMRIEARATLTIEELADVEDARAVETSIDGGRIWARAERLTGSDDRFAVETPVATASVRGTRFSIDCTLSWEEALESVGEAIGSDGEPDMVCSFTVIDGVVTITLPDGTEFELTAAQRLVVADDDRDPIGPVQLVPDELFADPWVAKNLGIDADNPDADSTLGGEAAANSGAATLAQDWVADVTVVSSSDPRFPVGSTDSADWEVSVDCTVGGRCTARRVVVDAGGAPAVRDSDGVAVSDAIVARDGGRYRFEADWTDSCERDGVVLAASGTRVRRVADYEVTGLTFTDGRWVADELTGSVTTTTELTDAGRAAGCALPNEATSVSFTTDVVATAD